MVSKAGVSVSVNERVLHVDDEPMICDVTRLCLEKGGRFKVDFVHTAEEALSLLRSGSYSCIISDYEMPTMNGLELLKEVRSLDPEIPFILFSGKGRETVVIDAINTGADFYIQKGGDAKTLFAELNHKVDYAINKRNARLSLKRRDAILEVVSLVATLFLGGETFNKALAESITLFGLSTEVDMVLVFRKETDTFGDRTYRRICAWSRLGDSDPAKQVDIHPGPSFMWEEQILKGEPVVGSIETFSNASRELLENQNIRSIAAFPVIANREVRGMIWFCDCLTERKWPVVEIDALQAAAAIVGSAIHQDEMRTELLAGKEQYESMYSMMRQLYDRVPGMFWGKELDERYFFINKETSDNLKEASDTDELEVRTQDFYLNDSNCRSSETSTVSISSDSGFDNLDSRIRESNEKGWSGIHHIQDTPLHLDIRKVPFSDNQQGNPIKTVGAEESNTKKDIECSFQTDQKKYARIFYQLNTGLMICQPDGSVSELNHRAAELMDGECEEMLGINIHTIPGLGDTGILRDFCTVLAMKVALHGRSEYRDIRGTVRILQYDIQPLMDEELKVLDVLLTIIEIVA